MIGKPFEAIVLGGRLLPETAATVGAEAVTAYGGCRADLRFLEVACVNSEIGPDAFNHEDAEVKLAMLHAAVPGHSGDWVAHP